MRKIRVLHFELDCHLGGIESFLLNLYSQIDRERVQFEFVTTSDNPALGEQLVELGGIIHKVSPYKNIFQYCADIELLLRSQYDVVHIHKNSAANIVPVLLAKKYNVPAIIGHSHNTAPSIGTITHFCHWLNRGIFGRTVDVRLACSVDAGKWMFKNDSFQVVSNGIRTRQFLYDLNIRNKKRSELGISDDTIVIGHVGRFTFQKNHKLLVDIFRYFVKRNPGSVLLLVGDGELRETVRKQVEEAGLLCKVIFAGVRSDVAELLMSMDAFVMPSIYEGLPIVGVEAQASGLPTFLSSTISKDTEISEAVTWFSIEQDVENIVEKIEIAIKNTTFDKRLKRNEQVVQSGYDMKSSAEKVLECYTHVLQIKNVI